MANKNICNEIGWRAGVLVAHEIGHALGAEHDGGTGTVEHHVETYGIVNDCSMEKHVMTPAVTDTYTEWSTCSRFVMLQYTSHFH